MAIIDYTVSNISQNMATITWSGLEGGDTGKPMVYASFADKTVQVFGVIDAPITIEGSNDPRAFIVGEEDDAVWEILTNNFGEPLSFSDEGMKLIAEAPVAIRPNCADGDTAATVIILANVS